MAKTKVTTHKFYVVDLVRKKPKLSYIEIPAYRVDIQIDVTTTGILSASEVPSAAMKRLEDAARGELERYENTIVSEVEKIDLKIDRMLADNDPKALDEAAKLVQGINTSVKNALAAAEGAAMKAVEERLKKEIQGDKNLKEARVRTGMKWGAGAISVAGNVASLVGTMGADVTAYVSIAKTLYDLGKDLQQQLKDEEKLRKDLNEGVKAFFALRENAITQAVKRQGVDMSGIDIKHPLDSIKAIALKAKAAGEEVLKGRDAKAVAVEVADFIVKSIKSQLADVEKARVAYRNHTVKTRERTDNLSSKADDLTKAMKAAKTLKDGVKIGAKCMEAKRSVTVMATKLKDREKYLDEMEILLKGNGLTIDDRTTFQKIRQLDLETIFTEGKELFDIAKDIYGLVSDLAG